MGCMSSKEVVGMDDDLIPGHAVRAVAGNPADNSVQFHVDGKSSNLTVVHTSAGSIAGSPRKHMKSFIGADLNAIVDDQGTINALVSRQLSMMSHYSVKSESGAVILEPEEQASKDGLKLNKLIGRGGFGNVYLGNWEGQQVAVKVVSANLNEQTEEAVDHEWEAKKEKMAQMEAILMSAMNHPNIVHTFKVTAYTGDAVDPEQKALEKKLFKEGNETPNFEWHIIMEYCDRGSLSRALAMQRFHEPAEPGYVCWDAWSCLEILKEITIAIMFLHENRILHGDLKAANVLLSSEESDSRGFVAKVSDFGLSRVLTSNKNHIKTQTFGTVTHMPPELLSKGVLSPTADVYAIGVLMWEIYTADRVFKQLSDSEVILAVVTRKLRPTFPVDCPSRYRYLAERCWGEMPEVRPSLPQLLHELEGLQDALCPEGTVSQKMTITTTMKPQRRPAPPAAAAPPPVVAPPPVHPVATHKQPQMSRLSQTKSNGSPKAGQPSNLGAGSPLAHHQPMPAITYSTPGMSSQSFTYQKGTHPMMNLKPTHSGALGEDLGARTRSFIATPARVGSVGQEGGTGSPLSKLSPNNGR